MLDAVLYNHAVNFFVFAFELLALTVDKNLVLTFVIVDLSLRVDLGRRIIAQVAQALQRKLGFVFLE